MSSIGSTVLKLFGVFFVLFFLTMPLVQVGLEHFYPVPEHAHIAGSSDPVTDFQAQRSSDAREMNPLLRTFSVAAIAIIASLLLIWCYVLISQSSAGFGGDVKRLFADREPTPSRSAGMEERINAMISANPNQFHD